MSDNIWSNEFNPFQKFKVLGWLSQLKSIQSGNFQAPVNIALDICQGSQEHKMCGGSFNCNFCMSNLEDKGLSTSIPKKLLLQMPLFFSEWGVKSLCLAGHHSDPVMYNHSVLVEFLRLCMRYNIEIGFVSNGAYYSDILLEEVARTCNWSGWSINAGTTESHELITGSSPGTFDKIIANIDKMSKHILKYKLKHDIGYKYLITDDNYKDILTGIKLAREIGVRHFQIRPTQLSLERTKRIDIESVNEQIKEGLTYEIPGKFEVFGIREKFTPEFTKKTPKRCIASPLGSTWKADGDIVICPDRRWSAHLPDMILGNFIEEGLEGIRRKWGGEAHRKMIQAANDHIGSCIRCTSYHWHDIYEKCIEDDLLDITLI